MTIEQLTESKIKSDEKARLKAIKLDKKNRKKDEKAAEAGPSSSDIAASIEKTLAEQSAMIGDKIKSNLSFLSPSKFGAAIQGIATVIIEEEMPILNRGIEQGSEWIKKAQKEKKEDPILVAAEKSADSAEIRVESLDRIDDGITDMIGLLDAQLGLSKDSEESMREARRAKLSPMVTASKGDDDDDDEEETSWLEKIKTAFAGITAFAVSFGAKFKKIIGTMGKIFGGIAKVAGRLMLPLTIAIGVVDGVISGFEEFAETGDILGALKQAFYGFIEGFTLGLFSKDQLGNFDQAANDWIMETGDSIVAWFGDIFSSIGKWFGDIGDGIMNTFDQAFSFLADIANSVMDIFMKNPIVELFATGIGYITDFIGSIISIITKGLDFLKSMTFGIFGGDDDDEEKEVTAKETVRKAQDESDKKANVLEAEQKKQADVKKSFNSGSYSVTAKDKEGNIKVFKRGDEVNGRKLRTRSHMRNTLNRKDSGWEIMDEQQANLMMEHKVAQKENEYNDSLEKEGDLRANLSATDKQSMFAEDTLAVDGIVRKHNGPDESEIDEASLLKSFDRGDLQNALGVSESPSYSEVVNALSQVNVSQEAKNDIANLLFSNQKVTMANITPFIPPKKKTGRNAERSVTISASPLEPVEVDSTKGRNDVSSTTKADITSITKADELGKSKELESMDTEAILTKKENNQSSQNVDNSSSNTVVNAPQNTTVIERPLVADDFSRSNIARDMAVGE